MASVSSGFLASSTPPPSTTGMPRAVQAKPPYRRHRHRADLLGLPFHQAPGHRVAGRGGLEEHDRQPDQVVFPELAQVEGDRHLVHGRQPEKRGDRRAQRGRLAPAVLGPRRPPHDLPAEPDAAAPVTGEGAEGEESRGLPVRRHADAVDAGAAGDGDAPRALAFAGGQAGPEHGEGVVGDRRRQGPALCLDRGGQLSFLLGQVGAGQAGRGVPRDEAAARRAVRPVGGEAHQLAEPPHRLIEAEVLVAGAGSADRREQRAVAGHQRHVGLAVTAVDREHRRGQAIIGVLSHVRTPPPARTRTARSPCSRRPARPRATTGRCPRRRPTRCRKRRTTRRSTPASR